MTVTLLPRVTVDFEALMAALLAYEGVVVLPAVDVDSFDTLPLVTFQGFNGHMIRNGFPEAGWEWTLSVTITADAWEFGSDLCDTYYQIIHGMEEHAPVAGIGWVSSVEDQSMFDRVGSSRFPNKTIVQYNGVFTVRVRPEQN